MKGKILRITIIFSLLLIAVTVILSLLSNKKTSQDSRSEQIVNMNEISQLIKAGDYALAQVKAEAFRDSLR